MIVFAVLFPALIGYLFLNVILFKKKLLSLPEKIAFSYLIGTSLLTVQMFIYALLRIKFSAIAIALPWLPLLPALFISKENFSPDLKKIKQIDQLLFALIGIKIFYVFFEALIKPVMGFDSIWNFSLRAKIFFVERMVPFAKASPYYLGAGMRQYPLQVPLLETWTFLAMGSFDDVKMKIVFPLYFCALLVVFYSSLRREKSRTQSLFFTFLLSTLPMLVYHATIEYADFIAGAYFFSAAALLYRYFEEKEIRYLVLSSILIGACAWVKDEGIVFYFICLLCLLLRDRTKNLKALAVYAVPFFVFILPWLLTKKFLGLTFGNDPNFSFFRPDAYLVFHPEVMGKIFQKTFLTGNWHLLPAAFIVFLVFYWSKIIYTNKKYLLFCFSGAFGFFMFLYLFTYNSGMVMSDIILSRNYLTYFPLGLFLIGIGFTSGEKALKVRSIRS